MVRGGLLIALTVSALAGGVHAEPSTACFTIQPGDTAASVAARVTGVPQSRHRPWFQILDPGNGKVIAKSQYDRIQAGWRACILQVSVASASDGLLDRIARVIRDGHLAVLLVGIAIVAALLSNTVDQYFTERQRTVDAMMRFGERFVREFERPLLQASATGRPIRSRLKANPDRRRLEILLAPPEGRRYPNLSDHKENVAYDVGRVLQLLRDQSFVNAPLYAEGAWVVVPFQFHNRPTQEGGA